MGKQAQLPDMAQPRDKTVVKLATTYAVKRDARIAVQVEERAAKAALTTAMLEKKLDRYEDAEEDLLVVLTKGKENVKVKTLSEQDEDDEEAGEDE